MLGLLQLDPVLYWQSPSRYLGGAASSLDNEAIDALVAERAQAKKDRDFARADAIRVQLKEQGVELEDRPGGATQWRRA